MSQAVVSESFEHTGTSGVSHEGGREFEYRPVPVSAPVSLILGLCSAMSLLTVAGVPVAFFGLVIGAAALLKIARSGGEFGGRKLAIAGLTLSTLFFVTGIGKQAYAYATEVPEGYARTNFTYDIAKKGFVQKNGVGAFHDDVAALDGQKIFLKGYMYPTNQTRNIQEFIFCKDSGECCFGGQPALTDMILVRMGEGQTVDYFQGLISVAGTFHLNASGGGADLSPVYSLDATHWAISSSAF
ncbi:DUF4190 domain-containing protein [Stratiformator vulcanicus]|nr:DUF4190 domain-containing protein [Stratiformator vulcanicus]